MIASLVRSGAIGTIVLDDGGVNRLSSSALESLDRLIASLPRDLEVLCLRSGRPGLFAAGADMREMKGFSGLEASDFSRLGQELIARIANLPLATVALIDGECHGGALDVIMAFDVRIATSRSVFAHPGARLGIVTGFGGTARIPRLASQADARAIFLAGGTLPAAAALGAGIVNAVVETLDGSEAVELVDAAAARRQELLVARGLLAAGRALDLPQLLLLATRTQQMLELQETN